MTESTNQPGSKSPKPIQRGFKHWEWVVAFLLGCVLFVLPLAWLVSKGRAAANRATCSGQATELAWHLVHYHNVQGHFPSPVIRDRNGLAMHSWRTELFRVTAPENVSGYNFDEPWDSEQNLMFATHHVPTCIHCYCDSTESNTSYVLVVGKDCFFKGDTHQPTLVEIADEVTLLIEANDSGILWTEPRDARCNSSQCQPSYSTDAASVGTHREGRIAVIVNRAGKIRYVRSE